MYNIAKKNAKIRSIVVHVIEGFQLADSRFHSPHVFKSSYRENQDSDPNRSRGLLINLGTLDVHYSEETLRSGS